MKKKVPHFNWQVHSQSIDQRMRSLTFIIRFGLILCLLFHFNSISIAQPDIDKEEITYFDIIHNDELTFEEKVREAELYFDEHGREKHSGYKHFERWKYNAQRNLGPDGKEYSKAHIRKELEKIRNNQSLNRSTSQSPIVGEWRDLGPKQAEVGATWSSHLGRITSIGVDRYNSQHFIVGGETGGIFETINEGRTWRQIGDDISNLNVSALAINPNSRFSFLAGVPGVGIMYTRHRGSRWTQANGIPNGMIVNTIAFHPTKRNVVLACGQRSGQIYRSEDGGLNWTPIFNTGKFQLFDIEFKKDDPNKVMASGAGVVCQSNDGGLTWEINDRGVWRSFGTALMMATTKNDPNYIYVLEAFSPGGYLALHRSRDWGQTWELADDNYDNTTNYLAINPSQFNNYRFGQAPRDMDIVVSPYDKNNVHIAGVETWQTKDGGLSFDQTSSWIHPNYIDNGLPFIHADVDIMYYLDDGKLLFGTDGGIFISKDDFKTVIDRTTGLGIRQFYRIGTSKLDKHKVVGGSQDNGTGTKKSDGQWIDWLGADGMECFIDHSNLSTVYGTIQNGGIYATYNDGQSFTTLPNPTDRPGRWISPFAQDPINPNVLYLGKDRIYKSYDGGYTWPESFAPEFRLVGEIAIAPSDNNTIYVGYSQNVYKTNNSGVNWESMDFGDDVTRVNFIDVHPTNPDMALVTVASISRVFETRDGGKTWKAIGADLPLFGANCARYDGTPENGIFVGMNPGIFYKNDDSGDQWTFVSESMPSVDVREIEITHDIIYAGTYGRGLWSARLANLDAKGQYTGSTITRQTQISKVNWKSLHTDDLAINRSASGNNDTYASEWIDLGAYYNINKLEYLPLQSDMNHSAFEFYIWNGKNEVLVKSDEWNNNYAVDIPFSTTRYVKLKTRSKNNAQSWAKRDQINLFGPKNESLRDNKSLSAMAPPTSTIALTDKIQYFDILIAPNPVIDQGEITVDMPSDGEVSFKVIDIQGKVHKEFQDTFSEGKSKYSIALDDLSSGTYQLVGTLKNINVFTKFVKQ